MFLSSTIVGSELPMARGNAPLYVRYTTEMFSRPRPELIRESQYAAFGLGDLSDPKSTAIKAWIREAVRPLRATGQGPDTSIGFFEQGIIVSAIFIVLPVALSIASGGG